MNKTDLVNVVAAETELKKDDVAKVITAVFDALTASLKSGDKVQLVGFGSFEVKETAAREGRNPKTGEIIRIAEGKKAVFSASKVLKDALNN